MAVVGAGLALNWGWLTAVGAAPLILSVAPCAAMCGLGLCMTGKSGVCARGSDPRRNGDETLARRAETAAPVTTTGKREGEHA